MPEDTKLSFKLFPAFNISHKIIYTKKLMVLCNNFDFLILEQNKVFDVIN